MGSNVTKSGMWETLKAFANAKVFGVRADGVTIDSPSLQSGLNAVAAAGGRLGVPAGQMPLGATGLNNPQKTSIQGSNQIASQFVYAGTADAVHMGGAGATLYYGAAMTDSSVLLTNTAGSAVKLEGTAGGIVENVYIEGPTPVTAAHSSIGVTVNGSNASSFFNGISNVICNHVKTGYKIMSGAVLSTCQMLYNCSSMGDVQSSPGNGSKGIHVVANSGNGTVVLGGNLEGCNTGIHVENSTGALSVFGTRMEANTTDIQLDQFASACVFMGMRNLDNVIDSSGVGYGRHMFWGNTKSNGMPLPNKAYGATTFLSAAATDITLSVVGYTGQTANLHEWRTSAGSIGTAITANGDLWSANHLYCGDVAPNNFAGNTHVQIADNGVGHIALRHTAAAAGKYRSINANSGNVLTLYDQNSVGMYLVDGGTAWASTSDERAKTIIEPISDALAKVAKMTGVIGRYNSDADDVRRSFLIAQQVRDVLPEAVTEQENGMLGLAYTDVIPLLVAALAEAKGEIDAIKAKIAA